MKNTIERIQDSIDDIKMAINTKYSRNGEEAPIEDDTLLEEYALAIDNIKTETIDVSQQIFVFYCGATNETDARSKILPTITGDDDTNKWNIECTVGGWSISADEEELNPTSQTDAEKYLYAMFVSVNTNTNSSNITWPDPVRLTGKTGAKGEDGSDGRDGVIAGLTLRNIITLYCASNNEPGIDSDSIIYEQGTDLSQLIPSNIKINDERISSDPTSYTNQRGSQTYEINPEHPIKIGKIDILYSSKSEATLLGNRPILITNTIDVEIKYGTSISPEISPDIWSDEYPTNLNNIVGVQRNEKLSDYTVKTIQYPIGLRGPAGIQFIGSVESENDLLLISLNYNNDYIGKLGVRVGQDVYVGYGTNDPNLTGGKQIGDYGGLNVGPLSPIPDWSAQEDEAGYIENRTHYVETITGTFGASSQASVPTSAFNITISNGSEEYNGNNIGHIISEESLPDGVTFNSTDNTYYFNSNGSAGECSYQITHQLDPKFVPQMIEISYDNLKNLRDTNQLIPGMQYRITDYVTTISQDNNTQVADQYHPFDLIVTADDESTLNEKARACHSERDTTDEFTTQKYEAWEIKYCIDNDTNRFTWADYEIRAHVRYPDNSVEELIVEPYSDDSEIEGLKVLYVHTKADGSQLYITEEGYVGNEDKMRVGDCLTIYPGGKGVIYYMKDEYGNECPYDFKNIKFKHPNDTSDTNFYYTFSKLDSTNGTVSDKSITEHCCNNVIKEYISSQKLFLNNIVFLNNTSSTSFGYSNTFGNDCHHNSFGNGCHSNTFGSGCYENSFGDSCYENSFGSGCYENSFGDGCYSNYFGNYCNNNSFVSSCSSNSFGNSCYFNSFGDNCDSNSFGNQNGYFELTESSCNTILSGTWDGYNDRTKTLDKQTGKIYGPSTTFSPLPDS